MTSVRGITENAQATETTRVGLSHLTPIQLKIRPPLQDKDTGQKRPSDWHRMTAYTGKKSHIAADSRLQITIMLI